MEAIICRPGDEGRAGRLTNNTNSTVHELREAAELCSLVPHRDAVPKQATLDTRLKHFILTDIEIVILFTVDGKKTIILFFMIVSTNPYIDSNHTKLNMNHKSIMNPGLFIVLHSILQIYYSCLRCVQSSRWSAGTVST